LQSPKPNKSLILSKMHIPDRISDGKFLCLDIRTVNGKSPWRKKLSAFVVKAGVAIDRGRCIIALRENITVRRAVTLAIELVAEGVFADFEQVYVFGHSSL
jgi:hypothetical protein